VSPGIGHRDRTEQSNEGTGSPAISQSCRTNSGSLLIASFPDHNPADLLFEFVRGELWIPDI